MLNLEIVSTVGFLCSLLIVTELLAQTAEALPKGFVDEVIEGVRHPVDIAFAPRKNGASSLMIVITRSGLVHVFDQPDAPSTPTVAADLSEMVCDSRAGLLGIEIHPNFEENRFIYLYYTLRSNRYMPCGVICFFGTACPFAPRNRLSRFVMRSNNTLDMDSEKVLLQTQPITDHVGGGMKFGLDGYLYLSIGDGNRPKSKSVSQNPGDLLGTVVRITDEGDIPPDNPFTQANGYESQRCSKYGVSWSSRFCEEIYIQGFRNPFRLAMDPNSDTVRFFVSDCGESTWESIFEGGGGAAGASGGWPEREGPCKFDSETVCAFDDRYYDPIYWYSHEGGGTL
jgi:glucose/arabinose dehydrogenase